MTNRSRKNLCGIAVIPIHFHNLTYQCNTILTDIVQTSHKRRYISSSRFGSQQSLSYRKYQCTIGTDTFGSEIFDSLDTICDTGNFYYDMRVECSKLFAFLNHTFIFRSNNLGTDITLYDVADFHIMFPLIIYSFDALFRHKRRVGGYSIENAHIIGFFDLV